MAGMELRSPAVIEVAGQRLTRLVGQSFCEELKLGLYKQILYVNMLQGLNGDK